MITDHPHVSRRSNTFDPLNPCRHFIQSLAFKRRFTRTSEAGLFTAVAGYCGSQGGGPLGEDGLMLTDDLGDRHRFFFETFFNRYDALTLGRYICPETPVLAVSAEVGSRKVAQMVKVCLSAEKGYTLNKLQTVQQTGATSSVTVVSYNLL